MLAVLCVPAKVRCGSRTFTTYAGYSSDPIFLDGSSDVFQSGGWHMGQGTICWAQNYGVKILGFYWFIQVMHGRPEDDPS